MNDPVRPTAAQRAEMAAYIDTNDPGLLYELGIAREVDAELAEEFIPAFDAVWRAGR
ncbi:hypothetical protein H7J07_04860 [Mycobacterium koreense]|uniref:hypothetical protein n=1 Tax=Mycolicibacillus koreensis TaxID=1069220 RepID=UPI00138C2C49|nr:hypothetical protein [Mycolicibacillus koreensis]MCV7247588.1 hypothetical protein [Mycolicibacillus koreensis]BBY53966.1 hypothetical protein MKOR_12170 [Mycolicibacillus koreensis]